MPIRPQDGILSGNIELVMIEPIAPPLLLDDCPIDWGVVLERHGRWLRLVVLSRLRDHHAADEVMQEIALAAVAQKSPIRDREKLGAWLRRLAVRQALMYLRGRGRQHRLMLRQADRGDLDGSSTSAGTLDWLVRDERSSMIREAVKRLPGRDAEILLLKYLEGWSYQKLAEHLKSTTSAVESRLHRARARLRNELTANRVIEVTE
jgi:RNA polymerase sigma factor (sigma-70 family)